jgi:IMP dehydrogenase
VIQKILSREFLTYDDVLIYPKYSTLTSRRLADTSSTLNGIQFGVPILSANMITVVSEELIETMYKNGARATLHQFDTIDKTVELFKKLSQKTIDVIVTVGTSGDTKERTQAMIGAGAKLILVDTPHAHNSLTKEYVLWFKSNFSIPLWVGNIATKEAAIDLIEWGVDGLKVGIGPGYACTTRIQTGIGVPQLTAVLEVVEEARKYKDIVVIADGGISIPGQFAKALGAGADLVMIGNLFAGSDESPGHIIEQNGLHYKEYFGSASSKNREVRSENFTDQGNTVLDFVEGASGLVPYRGSVELILKQLKQGLQSAMSYVGATNLKEYSEKVEFIKVSHSAQIEGGPRVL